MINPPLFAKSIYDFLNKKIKNLPAFWFEFAETNEPALIFKLTQSTSFNRYFNDPYNRIAFNVFLDLKSNSKHKVYELFYEIVNVITKLKLKDYEIALTTLNDVYITENINDWLNFDELVFDNESQTLNFKIDFLIKK